MLYNMPHLSSGFLISQQDSIGLERQINLNTSNILNPYNSYLLLDRSPLYTSCATLAWMYFFWRIFQKEMVYIGAM